MAGSKFTVIIQPEAEQDLDEAYKYLEDQKVGLGFELLEEVTEVVEVLEENPQIFQKVYGEKRRAVTKRFGYNLIYIIINPFVYILAILHGKRNPEEWKGRK